jgi:hypothetical protein
MIREVRVPIAKWVKGKKRLLFLSLSLSRFHNYHFHSTTEPITSKRVKYQSSTPYTSNNKQNKSNLIKKEAHKPETTTAAKHKPDVSRINPTNPRDRSLLLCLICTIFGV